MTETDTGTIRRQIVVDAPIDRAFAVFTERFGDFKPPEHNLLAAPHRQDGVRARGGGQHRRPGRRRQRVPLGANPGLRPPGPGRVQLGHQPRWQVETDPEQTSEVEVRFIAETPQRTRLELEHRNIDRHGPGWEAVSEGVAGDGGWPLYLNRYADLVTTGRAATA
jgi:hypothetical protein